MAVLRPRWAKCPGCAQTVAISPSGNLMPHRVGKIRCVFSGVRAAQMNSRAESLQKLLPGSKVGEQFLRRKHAHRK